MPQPRKARERIPAHDPFACGTSWANTCERCRVAYNRNPVPGPDECPAIYGPLPEKPRLDPQELVKAIKWYRTQPQLREALMELLLDDLVELVLTVQSERKPR